MSRIIPIPRKDSGLCGLCHRRKTVSIEWATSMDPESEYVMYLLPVCAKCQKNKEKIAAAFQVGAEDAEKKAKK